MQGLPDPGRMEADLREIGIRVPPDAVGRLAAYARLLEERASLANLIGPAELPRLWNRHLLESAAYALLLDPDLPVVDIGSGAGFPGLVLALLGFGRMILIEPRRKRRLFLLHAASVLGLADVRIAGERVEDGSPFPEGTQFTARAVAPPEELLRLVRPVSGEGSILVCRVPSEEDAAVLPGRSRRLPCPPLDRPGMLVQVRISVDPDRTRSHGESR